MRLVGIVGLSLIGACGLLDNCDPEPTLEPQECIAPRSNSDEYVAIDEGECGDTFEPNEDLTQATTETYRACEVSNETPLAGSIRDQADVDVFRTGACDRGRLASIGDTRILVKSQLETADSYLRMCVFAMCHDGATNLQACIEDDGTTTTRVDSTTKTPPDHLWSTRLDSGFTGCCRVGPGPLSVELVCQYASREIDTYFWVDTIDPDASCVGYELSYKVD